MGTVWNKYRNFGRITVLTELMRPARDNGPAIGRSLPSLIYKWSKVKFEKVFIVACYLDS